MTEEMKKIKNALEDYQRYKHVCYKDNLRAGLRKWLIFSNEVIREDEKSFTLINIENRSKCCIWTFADITEATKSLSEIYEYLIHKDVENRYKYICYTNFIPEEIERKEYNINYLPRVIFETKDRKNYDYLVNSLLSWM